MNSSVLTTKGQIVIPKELRVKYRLNPGTKVFFEESAAGIILKPVDAAFIKSAKGMIPKTKGDKSMTEWWPGFKAEENFIEERKWSVVSEPGASYKSAVKIKRKK